MSPSIQEEARAIIEAENQARLDATVQAVAERREQERQAAERAAIVARCKDRLAAMDTAPIEQLQAKATTALDAYVAAMDAYNAEIGAIRDELQALGSNLPAGVELYPHTGGLTIGDVEVRRQRMQTMISNMAWAVLGTYITRGNINLEHPGD